MVVRFFFVATLVLGVGLQLFYLNTLPAKIAIHFGADGVPDNWGSSLTFVVIALVVYGLGSALCLFPRLIGRLPDQFINIPNKEYWLRPENKSSMVNKFSRQMIFLGGFTNLFLIGVFHLNYLANMDGTSEKLNMPVFMALIGGYMVIILMWAAYLYQSFRLPSERVG